MLVSAIVGLINLIIKAVGFTIGLVISILPQSPFVAIMNQLNLGGGTVGTMLGYINSILDIPLIITIFNIWLVSVMLYYTISIVLKWVKAL